MFEVQGVFLGVLERDFPFDCSGSCSLLFCYFSPHGTVPAAEIANKNIKVSSFKSSEKIQKTESGPYCAISDTLS